jgi:hypothetical protein
MRLRTENRPVIEGCDDRRPMIERSRGSCGAILGKPIRIALLSAALALTAAPAAAAPGHAANGPASQARSGPGGKPAGRAHQARGIVQAISSSAVVLKQLDGRTVTVSLDARTHVFVDWKRAPLAAVKPGYGAVVIWQAGKPARELRAVDLPR